ncbi:MAG: RNA-guided endonuclease InsQ/TnpB family protein [Thermosynechococcus sp.]|uniref:RNA-guided endonuclease InsQ/TnpB family protein n=1 Tax=Thermosynechococcus sp. TaxID=2814275 RepID=UPI0039197200
MLNMTWEFKLEPTVEQVSEIEHILEVCRNVWNFALQERKDWLDSRKCPVNACSIRQEFILPADAPFPNYVKQCKALTAAKSVFPRLKTVNAQVVQQVIRKLAAAWESWRLKRSGFPRFKKPGRMRSKVKQACIVRKASGYFVMLSLEADVDVPAAVPHGHPVAIDVGLEYFLSTSDCGAELHKDLFSRVHYCHNCGSIKPRDVAAAQVICTRGQRGIENACGVDAAGAGITQSSWLALKQEIFGATQGITSHIA